jgi:hypothetical protein
MPDQPDIHTSGGAKSFHEELEELRALVEENLRFTKSLHDLMPKTDLGQEKKISDEMAENLQYMKASYATIQKIHRWIIIDKVFSIIKVILIVVPLVIGLIYLPPLIRQVFNAYTGQFEELKKL